MSERWVLTVAGATPWAPVNAAARKFARGYDAEIVTGLLTDDPGDVWVYVDPPEDVLPHEPAFVTGEVRFDRSGSAVAVAGMMPPASARLLHAVLRLASLPPDTAAQLWPTDGGSLVCVTAGIGVGELLERISAD